MTFVCIKIVVIASIEIKIRKPQLQYLFTIFFHYIEYKKLRKQNVLTFSDNYNLEH